MSDIRSDEALEVWQRGMEFVADVYAIARRLPSGERYGLISQLQRAAVSVPANIAEGHARDHTPVNSCGICRSRRARRPKSKRC